MDTESASRANGVVQTYNRVNEAEEGPGATYHFGGPYATEALAGKLAALGVDSSCSVVDLCCGWGGPAQYVASRFGCRVTAMDINARSVRRALHLARGTEVESLVAFRQADACHLPIAPGSVDVIWSQDAFCHIGDKVGLLGECWRALRPGGHLVFTDWARGDLLTGAEFDAFSGPWSIPALPTPDGYHGVLSAAGFDVTSREHVSREYVIADEASLISSDSPTYLQRIADRSLNSSEIVARFGHEYYHGTLELDKLQLYIAQAKVQIWRFVCRKPHTPP